MPMLTKKKRKRVVAALKLLETDYLDAERLMLNRDKEKLQEVLIAIDASYNEVMNLCGGMSDGDSMPGSVSRKIDCIRGKAEFDARVKQWLRDISTPACDSGESNRSPPASLSSERQESSVRTGSVRSSRSSTYSLKLKESRVKLNLARLAHKQNEERKEEAEQKAHREAEQAKQKAQQEAEQAKQKAQQELSKKKLEAEIADRESQRQLELAEAEVAAWEEVASVCSLEHVQPQNARCLKPIESAVSVKACKILPEVNVKVYGRPHTPTIATEPQEVQFTSLDNARCSESPLVKENCFHHPLPVKTEDRRPDKRQVQSDSIYSPRHRDPSPPHSRPHAEVGERFLPKPQISKFDGDPMDYWAFVNRYRIHIADRLDSDDLRLTYLLQHCTLSVNEKMRHHTSSSNPRESYKLAWQDLYDRYGQPHIIARCCERRLLDTPKIGRNDPDGLEKFAVLLKRCCVSLEEITGLSTVDSVGFLISLASKLPVEVQRSWVSVSVALQQNSGRVAKFADFADFVIDQSVAANSVFGKGLFPPASSEKTKESLKKQRVAAYNSVASVVPKPTQNNRRSATQTKGCPCCSKPHKLKDCPVFKRKPCRERRQLARSSRVCYRCLEPGHVVEDCTSKAVCESEDCGSAYHHVLLHNPLPNRKTEVPPERLDKDDAAAAAQSVCMATVGCDECTPAYLDIVPVRVRYGGKEVETYALLDSGSNITLCEKRLIEVLDVQHAGSPKHLKVSTLSTTEPQDLSTVSVPLTVLPLDREFDFKLPEVLVVNDIHASPECIPRFNSFNRPRYLHDVDLPQINGGSVMLLIGNNNQLAHRCLENRLAPDPRYPDAVRTPFGWLLKGPILKNRSVGCSFMLNGSEQLHRVERVDDLIVTDEGETFLSTPSGDLGDAEAFLHWLRNNREALEFGMKCSTEDVIAYDIMTRQVRHIEGHYQLPLMWRNASSVLPDTREMARRRLHSLERRLSRDAVLRDKYIQQMKVLLEKGYAEEIPADQVDTTGRKWYLPHHPVINSRKPEKIRIVFDCAAKCEGQSINDKLMKGPDLMNSLLGVLMRFRKEAVALVADIEAMFHQVQVTPQDRDAFRFLWWPGGDVFLAPVPHRMKVHLFGAKSSPSCATFCLRETAREFGKFFDPRVAEVVRKNFYVDDCLTSVPTVAEGVKLVQDLQDLLAMGGFKLTKWLSSNETVVNSVPMEERSKSTQNIPIGGEIQERVLGVSWRLPEDEFRFHVALPDKPITKRGMLSVTNSLFDPLGFVAPVVLEARLIYCDVCQQKLGWDDEVNSAEQSRWQNWRNSLSQLCDIRIPRFCKVNSSDMSGIQLHFFADASRVARGCVCYLRYVDRKAEVACMFVMGKSLLAGAGKHTIPRLELEAALDAVKMSRIVKQELGIENCPCVFWTDSSIVLQSLYADSKKYPVFSRNRISQIQKYTCVYDWMHVPTKMNPADLASRGTTAHSLVSTGLWFSGPEFLKKSPDQWPDRFVKRPTAADDYQSFKLERNVFLISVESDGTDRLMAYFSSLHRLKLAASWFLRFKSYLRLNAVKKKNAVSRQPISVDELKSAESELVKYVQRQQFAEWFTQLSGNVKTSKTLSKSAIHKLNPILVEGALRVGGRLENAPLDYEWRHPEILPSDGHLTDLIIEDCHARRAGHSGVNYTLSLLCQGYWVVNARSSVRRVLRDCLFCRRRDAKPSQQLMADLPPARLQVGEPPFSHVGVDYFGPMMVKQRRSEIKRYGCLFTCMTTRAVHLEVALDLSTDAFLNVLRRFLARRGPVTHIYSDNGTNFVGAKRLLKEAMEEWNQNHISDFLRRQDIRWTFNPPAASHMGGAWERMIRTVRRIMMAVIPEGKLDDDALHTLLLEVEAMVNSRPLTEVPLEVGEEMPLTPNHLLKINPSFGLPPVLTSPSDCYSRRRYRLVQHAADEFWQRWVREYPRTIISRQKWHTRNENLAVGDIVLLVDESAPRCGWPLGRVIGLFDDKHGVVRSVEVKTASGVLKRPIAKLCVIVNAERSDGELGEGRHP